MGDINGSYQRNATGTEAENRSRTSVQYTTSAVKAGEEITVPFEVSDIKNIKVYKWLWFLTTINSNSEVWLPVQPMWVMTIYTLLTPLLMSWADNRKDGENSGKIVWFDFCGQARYGSRRMVQYQRPNPKIRSIYRKMKTSMLHL